ncbi:hypothetical protein BCR32DRAFT_270306 [Anaeromyces robustus]|uniref:Uncharacterized protein n=1 Tax=Anaeromyces robustus TaxID=1754192 RepID=A0A1Y1WWS8_9FUNG|nr:hypothetical protein BCR32DRAFT_270306 [Anaeromyces robustus]|eukprot:ORX77980.1 hypothetical protein BCR32DRAFT_270306 [Anaeromyces robustus]
MLRAILSNRLSTNNEAKENRTVHKTPSKKGLNKTIGANKSLKNPSSAKKLSKFQNHSSDLNALNIISDDKELLKQNNLKTPLKISQQRAPLSNIKKTNIKEKSLKNLNNQLKKTPRVLKKKSSTTLSLTPSSSSTLKGFNNNNNNNNNNSITTKFHNENEYDNENTPLQYHHNNHNNTTLKRQNSLSHLSSSTLNSPISFNHNILKKSHSFETDIFNETSIKENNIFLNHMNKNINSLVDDDIEYMPPSLIHLEEEIEPKYKINYEDLLKFNTSHTTVVDSDLFERVNSNEDIDIGLDSKDRALKSKKFEFVDDFILNLDSNKLSKIKDKKEEKEKSKGKAKIIKDDDNKNESKNEHNNDSKVKVKEEKREKGEEEEESIIKKKMKEKALQEKLSQDFNLSFEEASEDEEIKLPDFLITDDKDSLYFDEIHL